MLYERVASIGMGQIGASFALAGKAAGLLGHVVGVARSPETLATAVDIGAADATTHDTREAVRDAELVYLAVPVRAMRSILAEIAGHLTAECLVTDAGSTKAGIGEAAARTLGDEVAFIGGHPMAGTERHGPASASAELFEGTTYLLCPGRASEAELARLQRVICGIGARPLIVEPERHDQIVALSSHLAHICSAALCLAVGAAEPDELVRFAAGGLRDTTRIAASDVEMWRDILAENAENVLPAARQLRDATGDFITAIEKEDWEKVARLLAEAKAFRDRLYPDTETD